MKAGHSKLDGYSATSDETFPSAFKRRGTASLRRLSPSACKAANSPPFSTPPAPADPLSSPPAVAPSSNGPTAETSRTTSCTKPSPPVPSHTRPSPPLLSETVLPMLPPAASPLAMPSMFADASFDCLDWVGLPPPNPPPHATELTAEPTCGLPPLSLSPASNARLVATTTMPATALLSRPILLLCKACETFLQDASMQSSRDGSYGPALRGGKNTKLKEANRRKWDKYGESFEEGLEPLSLTLPHALPLCYWEYHAGVFGSFLRAAAGWRS